MCCMARRMLASGPRDLLGPGTTSLVLVLARDLPGPRTS